MAIFWAGSTWIWTSVLFAIISRLSRIMLTERFQAIVSQSTTIITYINKIIDSLHLLRDPCDRVVWFVHKFRSNPPTVANGYHAALSIMLGTQFPLQCDFETASDGLAYVWCAGGATSFSLAVLLWISCECLIVSHEYEQTLRLTTGSAISIVIYRATRKIGSLSTNIAGCNDSHLDSTIQLAEHQAAEK